MKKQYFQKHLQIFSATFFFLGGGEGGLLDVIRLYINNAGQVQGFIPGPVILQRWG
jgi:hypothetical protein